MCKCKKMNLYNNTSSIKEDYKKLEESLIGINVLTEKMKEGKVVQDIIGNGGKIIGYIIEDNTGKKFTIFKNQIIKKNI